MSESKSIQLLLSEIQAELKVPKNQVNAFGKYKFRSCDDILEAVKPLLAKRNLCLTLEDHISLVGDRYYVRSVVSLFGAFSPLSTGNSVFTQAFAREDHDIKGMAQAQITGSASSYARKYALNGLFAIDDTEDADKTNDHGKGDNNQPKQKTQIPSAAKTVDDSRTLLFKSELKALLKAAGKLTPEAESVVNQLNDEQLILKIAEYKPK